MQTGILIISFSALVFVIAKLIGTYFREKAATRPLKLKIVSPSGESLMVELKKHMSREENDQLVKSLEELERRSTL